MLFVGMAFAEWQYCNFRRRPSEQVYFNSTFPWNRFKCRIIVAVAPAVTAGFKQYSHVLPPATFAKCFQTSDFGTTPGTFAAVFVPVSLTGSSGNPSSFERIRIMRNLIREVWRKTWNTQIWEKRFLRCRFPLKVESLCAICTVWQAYKSPAYTIIFVYIYAMSAYMSIVCVFHQRFTVPLKTTLQATI